MPRLLQLLSSTPVFLIGLIVLLAALLIPAHFATTSYSVLAEAAQDTETPEQRAELYLATAKPGPAQLIAQAAELYKVADKATVLTLAHPLYPKTGGEAPYLNLYLDSVQDIPEQAPQSVPGVLHLIARADQRQVLLDLLSNSTNKTVLALLDTRGMSHVNRFMPVYTPAGGPLESCILLTALLAQGDHLSPALNVELKALAEASMDKDPLASRTLEDVYLAILSTSKRLNWVQLSEWMAHCRSIEDITQGAKYLSLRDESLPTVYTASVLTGEPAQVAAYLHQFGKKGGWEDLDAATRIGEGALTRLFSSQHPIYRTPKWLDWIQPFQQKMEQHTPLPALVEAKPTTFLLIKTLLLLAGGFLCAWGIALFVTAIGRFKLPTTHPLRLANFALYGSILTLILIAASEPAVLQRSNPSVAAQPHFSVANLASTIQNVTNMDNLEQPDTATYSVLIFFLIVQLVIYCIGLMKIAHIRKAPCSAALKLKLLENEDNLFDTGLYVGLGGTVVSLILLVLNIGAASLMAAYASTLFGILFVAILKIMHVRPFRRKLIMESEGMPL